MTQKTKLEIIGPYTPEHEGPYALKCNESPQCFVHAVVNGKAFITMPSDDRPCIVDIHGICNAREVPVAREFWVIGGNVYTTPEDAALFQERLNNMSSSRLGIIHVREALPGEGA